MAASDEIRKTKRNKKSTNTSGQVPKTTSGAAKSGGFVSSLVKILVYSSILVGLSSQFEATRPIYKEYAHPYVATYVQVSSNLQSVYIKGRAESNFNKYLGYSENSSGRSEPNFLCVIRVLVNKKSY